MNSGVTTAQKELVLNLIKKYFPMATIMFFGSRQRDEHKENSDLDLCLNDAGKPLALATLSNLKEALSSSTLPFKVDLVDWNRITPEFRSVISADYSGWEHD